MHLLRTTKGNAIEQFNNIALFCTSLILIFTGARPNEDPFDDPENLGLDSHLILIGDKIIDERAPFRLAPLPKTLLPDPNPQPLSECISKLINSTLATQTICPHK